MACKASQSCLSGLECILSPARSTPPGLPLDASSTLSRDHLNMPAKAMARPLRTCSCSAGSGLLAALLGKGKYLTHPDRAETVVLYAAVGCITGVHALREKMSLKIATEAWTPCRRDSAQQHGACLHLRKH